MAVETMIAALSYLKELIQTSQENILRETLWMPWERKS